jgi:hypothetical protein
MERRWGCGKVGRWVGWSVERMAAMRVEWTDTVMDGYLAER